MKIVGVGVMVGVGVAHAPQSDGQVEQDSPPEHDPLGQVTGGGVGAGVDVGAF